MIDKLLNKHISNLRKILECFRKKHKLNIIEDFGLHDFYVFFDDHYCLSLDNIIYDLDSSQPAGLILEWFDTDFEETVINFKSYSMGLRKKEDVINDLKENSIKSKKELLKEIKNSQF